MKKRFLFIVMALALVCLFALTPQKADAAELASGTCGDNLTWVLTDDGVLTISGTGAMTDYFPGYEQWAGSANHTPTAVSKQVFAKPAETPFAVPRFPLPRGSSHLQKSPLGEIQP